MRIRRDRDSTLDDWSVRFSKSIIVRAGHLPLMPAGSSIDVGHEEARHGGS